MKKRRDDRIFFLDMLVSRPGADNLDLTFWLPPSDNDTRRVWMRTEAESPVIRINDTTLSPVEPAENGTRWLDFGCKDLPLGFSQLRIRGLSRKQADASHLVVTEQTNISFSKETIQEAEKKLWGICREDVGRTFMTPASVEVGAATDFTCIYRAGPTGLPPGSFLRFGMPVLFDTPQVADPCAPGFIRILSANRPGTIELVEKSIESHEKNDIFVSLPDGLPPSGSLELEYHTDRMYIYPQKWSESDRIYWYSKQAPLGVAVAISAKHPFVSPADGNSHCFEVTAGKAERLHLVLPGRRHQGEKLILHGTWTDRYRNVPALCNPDLDLQMVLVSDSGETRIGNWVRSFVSEHGFETELPALSPGIYRAEARCPDGTVSVRSNPMEIVTESDSRPPVYWGEIHAHTRMSDGAGEFSELYRHAMEFGHLDFAAAADHACYFSDNEWQWMQDVTNYWNEKPGFATLVGYEWAGKQVHRNIYTSRDQLRLFRGMYEPESDLAVPWKHFKGDDQVAGGPHGLLSHGVKWTRHDPDVERFAEIYSMWGAGDSRDNALTPDFAARNKNGMAINDILKTGARLGFTGGGDCHEGHAGFSSEDPDGQGKTSHTFARRLFYRCGLTAAAIEDLSREALLDALRNRKTWATTGARILMDFSVSGIAMGQAGKCSKAICKIAAHAQDPIERVELLKNGEPLHCFVPTEQTLDLDMEWNDPAPALMPGTYYYVHVLQKDGQQAWTSPVWITA